MGNGLRRHWDVRAARLRPDRTFFGHRPALPTVIQNLPYPSSARHQKPTPLTPSNDNKPIYVTDSADGGNLFAERQLVAT